jgi:hypothetical protein
LAGQSIKLLPVVYYTDKDGNQIHQRTETVRQMIYDGDNLYLRNDKSIKITSNGSSFSAYTQTLDERDIQYIAPKTYSSNTEIYLAMSKGLFKLPAGTPAEAHTIFPS